MKLADLESALLIGSTLVEGSTLTEDEARQVLAGRTVSGHPMTEIRELLNYRAAAEHLLADLRVSPYLSVDLITAFHERLFRGLPGEGGRFKTHQNFTYRTDGTRHEHAHPGRVEQAMRDWVDRFNGDPGAGAAVGAAALYYAFEDIHPFADGNGRVGRVLVAYWLHWKWRRRFSFYLRDKIAHHDALEAANGGELAPLAAFFEQRTEDDR